MSYILEQFPQTLCSQASRNQEGQHRIIDDIRLEANRYLMALVGHLQVCLNVATAQLWKPSPQIKKLKRTRL